ncbi:polymer-forming cytoskeletal protein [Paenibacillus mendelii]|uniref:Polymer-forming cytoskeletal protein n=1 Tax=Paenibacillus mendelii TaxID=206163 RepID=A0ABV6JBU6_9BACL|nr:polymer-forming cytoskeletal protein [Paenibacillus mendelii]MCQ6562611.1 polymer-forming cytoskeletal protein [Paenibacillus mendelii]
MTEQVRPDLVISGMGSASGGDYGKVRIEGTGKVDGDLSCESIQVSGMAAMGGNMTAGRFELQGKLTGVGSLKANTVDIEGHVNLRGRLQGDDISLTGILKLQGDCEAERFAAHGGFAIQGLLNAGTIDIHLHGRGEAAEIGGETIRVRKPERQSWGGLLRRLIPAFNPRLTTGTIEGDDVHLEATTAGIVRGSHVHIGEGCEIRLVEYRTELIVHPDANVAKRVKI